MGRIRAGLAAVNCSRGRLAGGATLGHHGHRRAWEKLGQALQALACSPMPLKTRVYRAWIDYVVHVDPLDLPEPELVDRLASVRERMTRLPPANGPEFSVLSSPTVDAMSEDQLVSVAADMYHLYQGLTLEEGRRRE
jgi:hypothetical protein